MRRWLRYGVLMCAALLAVLGITAGIRMKPQTADLPKSSAEMGLVLQEDEDGLYVLGVSSQSAAAQSGIQPGDYLLSLGDTALDSLQQLDELIEKPEHPRRMTLRRRERELTVLLP